jgi:HlyD family secretion protein
MSRGQSSRAHAPRTDVGEAVLPRGRRDGATRPKEAASRWPDALAASGIGGWRRGLAGVCVAAAVWWASALDTGPARAQGIPGGQASPGGQETVLAQRPVRKTLTVATKQPARIEAMARAPLVSKLVAHVSEVLVDYGDHVEAGQLLVRLAAPEVEAQVAHAQAEVVHARSGIAQAQAALQSAQAAAETARLQIRQAEAVVARQEAELQRWKSEHARTEQLVARGSLSPQLAEEVQQKHLAAQAAVAEARAAVASAQAQHRQLEAQILKATADVQAASAQLQLAQARLTQAQASQSYLQITAPFEGVVVERRVDPGHLVQPGGSPLLVIAQVHTVRAWVEVPESEAALVDVDDPLVVEVPALAGRSFPGKVTRTSFALTDANRTLLAIADLDNRQEVLRPGMYATARITLQQKADVLTLPLSAVVCQARTAHCFRVLNGKAVQTPVELGLIAGEEVEIVAGVSERDLVVLNKASSLKDGQAVVVLPAKAN